MRSAKQGTLPARALLPFLVIALAGCGAVSPTGLSPHPAPIPTSSNMPPLEPIIKPREVRSASDLIFNARLKRYDDPQGALDLLKGGLSKWGDVPDVRYEMARAADHLSWKVEDNREEKKRLLQENLGHLEEAMRLIKSGKRWLVDPMGCKTANLQTSIEQAKLALQRP